MKVRIIHPLHDEYKEYELESGTTVKEIGDMLLRDGFVAPKRGGYHFIINDELCAVNMPISAYIEDVNAKECEIRVHGLLTMLI